MTKKHELIRVLVIDDSAFSRQLITRMLEKSPLVEVIGVARDGEDALRKTLELSLIRGEPSMAEMPICVITTEGAKEDRERAISLGANEYLTKPIQANKVLAVAKSLLKISD
jgi:two-component system chemotaxis response regulator CheY